MVYRTQIIYDGNELQVNIGSAQRVNSPRNLIAAFQKAERIGELGKDKNRAVFDNVDVKNYFCEKDGF